MTMKWMGARMEFHEKTVEFPYHIEHVISYKDTFIVLLNIPEDSEEINNIYCLAEDGRQLWQSEDLNLVRKGIQHLPYEAMEIKEDYLFAADFYGRHYKINPADGKILEYTFKK